MGFLNAFKSLFSADPTQDQDAFWIYVRSARCDEPIKTRVNLKHDLSLQDDGGYITHKTLVGNDPLCLERVEVTLIFDENRRLIDRTIVRGEFITAEEFEDLAARQS